MDVTTVVIALVTLVAGLAAGWALARTRGVTDSATAIAERDAARADIQTLRAERDRMAAEASAARNAAADASARLETERAAALEKVAMLQQAEANFTDAFARLSQEALARNNTQFLEAADSRFALAGKPLTETLGKVEQQLREIEKERMGTTERLTEQINGMRLAGETLRIETTALVNALSKPQARGRWGELQLRKCVEFAGMTDRCDFTEQTSVTTSDGLLRPDLVVRLTGGKNLVVDSKVTLAAYLEAHEATDELVREQRLDAHARHLRKHVEQLAAKSYWSQFNPTPEFVMLFVPGEAFLAPALDRDPTLLEDALKQRVHIVTPTSLVSALRTVAYTWQQDALADNAREVFELGRELYKRLGTMGGHVDKLGRSLSRAVTDYNGTVGSLESQVLVTARKLHQLQVTDELLAEPAGIEASVRPLSKMELVASAEQSRALVALPSAQPALTEPELDRVEDYGIELTLDDAEQRKLS
ncbi:MAG TPA: DNA recombination protein RmuC [Mycobacteriales bacterium]|jgi:DNA recombination protein RmuC|nr:DNA recombination protein RmuC [Mycobacteriales bacterium]